jgi:SAM-dependent methyltransferase
MRASSESHQCVRPRRAHVLDVACRTGEHAKFLQSNYRVDGIDINEDYLRAARRKNPPGNYICGDMTDFYLNRTYDVVTCLFSAIGYVRTVARLEQAISCMARHVRLGGVLLVEPWFVPDQWQPGTQFIHAGQVGKDKVCRMSLSLREENRSVILLHYLTRYPEWHKTLPRASRVGVIHPRRDDPCVRSCRYASAVRARGPYGPRSLYRYAGCMI